jgi:hypothetical protein
VSAILTLGSNQNVRQPQVRFAAAPLASRLSGFWPALSGGIGGIGLMSEAVFLSGEGGIGGRTPDFLSMASYDALLVREAQALDRKERLAIFPP